MMCQLKAYIDDALGLIRVHFCLKDPIVSHKHINLIRHIFHDPVSGNIHWREIESLLVHLGASFEPAGGARFHVKLNGFDEFLHHPHQSNVYGKQEIKHLREFLARAGVTPSIYENGE